MNGQSSEGDLTRESPEAISAELTSPTALRQLVLNYLVHHCYIDTAQAFVNDGIGSDLSHNASASSKSVEKSNAAATSSHLTSKQLPPTTTSSSNLRSNGSSGHTRSSSRLAGSQHALSSAHPLSAPPLSHEDSSMELEVDSLLAVADGRPSASASNGHTAVGTSKSSATNGQAGQTPQSTESANLANGDEELSALEMQRVRIRKEIRDHIVAGRIRQAVDLCNAHFPNVLRAGVDGSNGGNEDGHKVVKGSGGVGDRSAASLSAARNGEQSGRETPANNERILPANPTSLKPAHLSLNLQIQAFIECVRAASSTQASANVASPSSLATAVSPINAFQSPSAMPNMHTIVSNTPGIAAAAAAISRSASPAPSSSSSTGSATSANGMSNSATSAGGSSTLINPVLHAALRHAQNLYSEVQSLPPYWRSMYLKELESVTTMLAYTDLERSPVRKYLDQSRRVALAEQINSAIMFRTGKPSQPLIESAVRQTTFCWSTLAYDRVPIPADHAIFSSGAIVGLDRFDAAEAAGLSSSAAHASSATSSMVERNKNKGKILPPWDLHTFLRER